MKNKLIIPALIMSFVICFTSCGNETDNNLNNEVENIPVEMPDVMQTAQSYLMDKDKFSRVKTADGEYLLAFHGRIEGETEDKNRIIYLNKFNEIVKDFNLPFTENINNHDFYFGEKYVMLVNRQYSGVDADGNMHGITILDTDGNMVANFEPRDPYIFTDIDKFTRFNRTGYSWYESADDTIIFNTPFAIYEYDIKNNSLDKLIGLEDIIVDLDYDKLFEDTDYTDFFGCKYGIFYMFRNDEQGLVFSVNEKLEKDLVQYTSSEKFTMYALKNGEINQLTDKDEYEGILLYNDDGTCMIYTSSEDKTFVINSKKYSEYDYSVRRYIINDYAFRNKFVPFVAGSKTSSKDISVNYFDSINNIHYDIKIPVDDATIGGAVYDMPFIAYGKYIYFASDDVMNQDKSYRYNVETGKGDFVYGNVENVPLCSEYRLFNEYSTSPGFVKIQIFKDYIL